MVMDLLKKARRKAAFGVENVRSAPGRMIDKQRLNAANRDAKSAVNKTGQAFAYRELGPGYERGYDEKVKKRQKSELERTSKVMQSVSENDKMRLKRLKAIDSYSKK
jgi:hypothetical protein